MVFSSFLVKPEMSAWLLGDVGRGKWEPPTETFGSMPPRSFSWHFFPETTTFDLTKYLVNL